MATTVEHVVCPFCGCCCDDIQVTVDENRITKVRNSCTIGSSKFLDYLTERETRPLIRKKGEVCEASLDEAVDTAAKILLEAKYPLLYGWSSTCSEAQRVGVELAERVGGILDNTSSVCHGPTIEAVQDVGESTATLGHIRNRSDLMVFWGCNPAQAHIRHLTRYSSSSKGRFISGRKERKIIVVDVRRTTTARTADLFLKVTPNQDYELITALRMAVEFEEIVEEQIAGIPVSQIEELADMMRGCKLGSLQFGLGLTTTRGRERNIEAVISLIRDLNKYTKFILLPMRGHFNVTGANKVSTWQTGYPFAVDFSQGYPRYNPGETSTAELLARNSCDALCVVASDPVSNFPRKIVESMSNLPKIVIDPHMTPTGKLSDVYIPTATVGIETEGTIYRMDGVPLLSKKLVDPPSGVPTDHEVLQMILRRVKDLKEERAV
jgi:formylmethanofuran dehydrogenase subunit B